MTFEIVKGDLFDPSLGFQALAQGVNTKGKMGAGIAVEFRTRWPGMYVEYQRLCSQYTDILPGLIHIWDNPNWGESDITQVVYNLFSQDWPGPNGSYQWLASSALLMRLDAETRLFESVGLPWIGCGIAKLEKHNVQHLFNRILDPSEVDFVLVEQ